MMVIAKKKPLLRGWSHAAAAVGAVAITLALVVRSLPNRGKTLSLVIFGATLILLYTVSATYHIFNWSPAIKSKLRIFDHINIFLLIAGTYTPLCWNLLHGAERIIFLCLIWSLAAAGVAAAIFTNHLPRWLSPVLYVAMGWVALGVLPAFIAESGWHLVALMIGGGLFYTAGSVIYALRRPDPWPSTFGFHEVFHLFTIAGGLCFALAMFLAVLPA